MFKIHAGDFGEGNQGFFRPYDKTVHMPKDGAMFRKVKYSIQDVEACEHASEESVKRIGGTVGWGAVGGALLGPVGLLAGLLAGGKGNDVTFIISFNDGKKALCSAKSKHYKELQAALFR